jgi:hypothetical protein
MRCTSVVLARHTSFPWVERTGRRSVADQNCDGTVRCDVVAAEPFDVTCLAAHTRAQIVLSPAALALPTVVDEEPLTSPDGVCTIGISREPVRMVALKSGRLNVLPDGSKNATWSEKKSPVAEYS